MNITPSHAKRLNFQLKACVLGSLLLCTALGSSALTIGRMRGTAWLGQPLDVTIQVQYDETESLSTLCFDAEVFHADTRQDAARVRVSVEGSTQAQTAQVRVQSSAGVDEPVVSVYLRESCVSKSSRRYVLLTELAGETVPSATLTAVPTPSGARAAAVPVVPKNATAVVSREPVAAPVKPVAAPTKGQSEAAGSKPAAPAAPRKPPEPPKTKAAPEAAGKSQLKLDPLSSLSERVAQLEDVTLATQTAEGDREALRLKKMEESVQALMALSAKNERSMAELRARLQQAEAEKYDNPLVYGLAAMLLAALGAAAFFWRRQQDGGDLRESNGWRGRMMPSPRMPEAAMPLAVMTPPPVTASSPVPDAIVAAAASAVATAVPQAAAHKPDVDLDDLMAAIVPEPVPHSEATPAEASVEEFPALTSAAENEVADNQAETPAGYHEFPAAGEVHIDVSHLSLTPVEPAAPAAPPEVLLDFDFPEFEKKDVPESGGAPKKDAPPSAGG